MLRPSELCSKVCVYICIYSHALAYTCVYLHIFAFTCTYLHLLVLPIVGGFPLTIPWPVRNTILFSVNACSLNLF